MKKKRSICRLSAITAVAAATTAIMRQSAAVANTAAVFLGTQDASLLNTNNYSSAPTFNTSTDLEFGTGYPSAAALVGTQPGALTVGTIDDLNTSYAVTMSNNTSTGNALTLGSTSTPNNSLSPVSASDLLYVPASATLNIAANTGTGLTSVALGSGNLDIAGTATIQGIISGTSGLTKTGNGTLILYQADTYTGTSVVNMNISAGTVQIGTGTALGSSTSDITLIGAATLYCYDNVIPSYSNSFSSGRTFNISSATSTIRVGGTETWTIGGSVIGSGMLNVAGPGTLIISSSSDAWTGNTNISSGTLDASAAAAVPTGTIYIQNGATFAYNGSGSVGATYGSSFLFSLAGGNDAIAANPTTAGNDLGITSAITGSGTLVKTGTGILLLSNSSNAWTGGTNISSGILDVSVLTAIPHGTTTIQNGATFQYNQSGTAQYSSSTNFALGGGIDTFSLPISGQVLTLFGTIGGTGTLLKTGNSTLILQNTSTYTGGTNLSAGSSLTLAYQSSTLTTSLSLGGVGGSSAFTTQAANSSTGYLNSISTITSTNISGGGDAITLASFNVSSQSLGLGSITRGGQSTLNITLPAVGSVTTTATPVSFAGGQASILGGYLTVNGSSWAVSNSGTLTGLTSYDTAFDSGSDVDAIASISPAASAINSLRFNTAAAVTVSLAAPLSIATGGILETANVAANASLISGGSLTSGNGTDLIISQFNTTAPLTISSPIVGNIALTKSGPGSLILSGTTSNYSGGTMINAGTLGVTSDAALGAVPASAATNITFAGTGATLQLEAPLSLSANRTIQLGIAGGTIDTNSYPTTFNGTMNGSGLVIANTTAASTGIFTLGNSAVLSATATLGLGGTVTGANFSVAAGRASNVSFGATSLLGGDNSISAASFSSSSYNLSLGAISHTAGSTVSFNLPATGNIITTSVNANYGQGQQTILGAYATVNGTTWAVSGSGATAGVISGLATAGYDTAFDNTTDVDATVGDADDATSASYINSLRFNVASPLTLTLGPASSISPGVLNAVSLYIATGGILETANVGANADVIASGVLSSNNGSEIIVTQNNTAAPLTISSQIINFNVSGINLGLTKAGPGTLILSGSNTYTGKTFVNNGSMVLANSAALPAASNLSIGASASVVASNTGAGTYALSLNTLTNDGLLDLTTNAAIIHTGTTLAAVTAQVEQGFNKGGWNGSGGITSSSAAADTTHLTALGVIVNDLAGTPLYGTGGSISASFEGSSPVDGDLLVKLTYYGDTNLDGLVDGTDYSRIDAAYLADQTAPGSVTGWFNGDFNYDGVVNGSDYTLIDNAFNSQGAPFTALIAAPSAAVTAVIAGASAASAVPEPASLGVLALGALSLLGRRRRARQMS